MLMTVVQYSCTSSRISYTWKSQIAATKPFNKILVIALNGEKDAAIRQKMEKHLTDDLKSLGYLAASAMEEYGPAAFRNLSEAAMLEKLEGRQFDAVITIVLLDKTKEKRYVPDGVYYSPYSMYYRRFYGYYNTMYDRVYASGYYTVDTRYFWESNLYDMNQKELLYTVQTQSFDPASYETLAHEYGKLIVGDMVKKQVLSQKESLAKSMKE